MPSVLAVSAPSPQVNLTPLLVAIGVGIAVLVVLGLVVLRVRARLLEREQAAGTGSFMEEIRRMRREGRISEAEFDALRRKLAAKMAGGAPGTAAASSEGNRGAERASTRAQAQTRSGGGGGKAAQDPPAGPLRAPPGYDLTGEPLPAAPPPE